MSDKTAELPKCHDRWCKNKARYSSAEYVDLDTDEEGPQVPVCKMHQRIYDEINIKEHARFALYRRLDYAKSLESDLSAAFARESGIEVKAGHDSRGLFIQIPVETATRLLEWLS